MTQRILFIDDEPRVLDALRRMLRPYRHFWDVTCIDDPRVAWDQLQTTDFDAIVSDVSMPGMSGLELLGRVKASERLNQVPVVMLTGLDSRELKRRSLDLGAADLLTKPIDPEDLVARLRSVLKLKAYQDELAVRNNLLEQTVEERTAELYCSRMDVIWRLAKAAEHRDNETGNHVIRVGCISRILAEAMGMDRESVKTLFVAAPLHDIGKIGVPDAILMKPGPLTNDEWSVMKQHCQIGARILRENPRAEAAFQQWFGGPRGRSPGPGNPTLQTAARIALMHHERWDGTGYPRNLAGEEIALEARIVAIADVFDALTSDRPYKVSYTQDEALQIIRDKSGSHFDPRVYAAFEKSLPAIRSTQTRLADSSTASPNWKETCDETNLVCR